MKNEKFPKTDLQSHRIYVSGICIYMKHKKKSWTYSSPIRGKWYIFNDVCKNIAHPGPSRENVGLLCFKGVKHLTQKPGEVPALAVGIRKLGLLHFGSWNESKLP